MKKLCTHSPPFGHAAEPFGEKNTTIASAAAGADHTIFADQRE